MSEKSNSDQPAKSVRPAVSAMEDILGREIPVLDHGFIRLVDYMGDDSAIVQAARVSYGKGTKTSSEDGALINYLMRHSHTTPFEMCELKLHIKLPIFVARQWVRHRTANINEYSARYSILDSEFYVPSLPHISMQSSSNKQGRSNALDDHAALEVQNKMIKDAENAFETYRWLLSETPHNGLDDSKRAGVARELARIGLPLSAYTQWYWKIDLQNLFRFLQLRCDPHAQLEIRAYADEILRLVKIWVPLAHAAFLEHQMEGTKLSGSAVRYLSKLLSGSSWEQDHAGLSNREWQELRQKFSSGD